MQLVNDFLDACKNTVRALLLPIAKAINSVSGGRLSPAALTLTALAMHVVIAWLIGQGYYIYSAVLLLVFGLFDALDGALARLQGSESKRGMLLDSVTDRIKEVMLYTGAAVSFVNLGRPEVAYWAVLACGASLCVSYINAWGEVLTAGSKKSTAQNLAFRSGLARYEVRMFLLLAGLLTDRLLLAVIVITVISVLTIIERLVLVSRRL